MSDAGSEQDMAALPIHADPAWGAVIGTFLLASCLAGPIALAVALVVLLVIETHRRDKRRGVGSSSHFEATEDEFGARFRELENDILGDDQP